MFCSECKENSEHILDLLGLLNLSHDKFERVSQTKILTFIRILGVEKVKQKMLTEKQNMFIFDQCIRKQKQNK